MPVFFIMFQILHGMTYEPTGGNALVAQAVLDAGGDTDPIGFMPRFLSHTSDLYLSLVRAEHMNALGLDLSVSPANMLGDNFARGLVYALLVVVLGALYWVQQRMVAARAAVSPTMSPAQQKLMQYLPVAFAVFQVFFLLGLVIYYIVQTILRIAQQYYITKRFYSGDQSLGRQAQAASERARELAKQDGGSSNPFKQAKQDLADQRGNKPAGKGTKPGAAKPASKPANGAARSSKRTTAPKNRPTASGRPASGRPGGTRPTSNNKRRRG
jgi:YidC/Oxa1 family membrane protein insertase